MEIVDLRKQIDVALIRKRAKVTAFDTGFLPTTQLLEAEFRAAGHVELADRIRPTVRQLSRADEGSEEETEAATPPESTDSTPDEESSTASDEVSSTS